VEGKEKELNSTSLISEQKEETKQPRKNTEGNSPLSPKKKKKEVAKKEIKEETENIPSRKFSSVYDPKEFNASPKLAYKKKSNTQPTL
jgi:hypothetical protein